jgi:hypothetical protein
VSAEKEALAVFWRNKRFWLIQSLAIAAWTLFALSWFWLPDSAAWGVALAAVQGIVVIASGVWLMRRALVFYGREHTPSAGRRRLINILFDLALFAAIGGYLPYKLIGWHPVFPGLAMQTASLAIRFVAAFLLAVSAWLILASALAAHARSSS